MLKSDLILIFFDHLETFIFLLLMCCDSLRKIVHLFYFPPFPFQLQKHDKTQSPPLDYYLDYVGCTFSHKNHSGLLSLNFIYICTHSYTFTHIYWWALEIQMVLKWKFKITIFKVRCILQISQKSVIVQRVKISSSFLLECLKCFSFTAG